MFKYALLTLLIGCNSCGGEPTVEVAPVAPVEPVVAPVVEPVAETTPVVAPATETVPATETQAAQ